MAIVQLPRFIVPVSSLHTVKPGESLGKIASQYGVSANALATSNPGAAPGGVLAPGTRLHIPTKTHPARIG
jgi:LysM repeat protein